VVEQKICNYLFINPVAIGLKADSVPMIFLFLKQLLTIISALLA